MAKMNAFDAVMAAEGCFELVSAETLAAYDDREELQLAAFQQIIDDGSVWRLQGSFGRTAANLIQSGLCTVPA